MFVKEMPQSHTADQPTAPRRRNTQDHPIKSDVTNKHVLFSNISQDWQSQSQVLNFIHSDVALHNRLGMDQTCSYNPFLQLPTFVKASTPKKTFPLYHLYNSHIVCCWKASPGTVSSVRNKPENSTCPAGNLKTNATCPPPPPPPTHNFNLPCTFHS